MSEYVIITDSGCDIDHSHLKEWGVTRVDMPFRFEGDLPSDESPNLPLKVFYQLMRDGKVARTSAVNPGTFNAVFEHELKAGHDILYIGFSSGLSGTVTSARIAADDLLPAYPDRKIEIIDTLCASAGQGLILYLAAQKKKGGSGLDETAGFVKDTIPHLVHWFTVDDLVYLKRGGRINAASAFAATVLKIKPVLHVDDEGHLINMAKVRGRHASLRAMADKFDETCIDPKNATYFISHGDCREDAEALEAMIFEKHGCKASLICDIGPVIGAHSGPGTLALFFVGEKR